MNYKCKIDHAFSCINTMPTVLVISVSGMEGNFETLNCFDLRHLKLLLQKVSQYFKAMGWAPMIVSEVSYLKT